MTFINHSGEVIIITNTSNKASVPPAAARSYIIDMLGELCSVAEGSEQTDILALLKLVRQAVSEIKQ